MKGIRPSAVLSWPIVSCAFAATLLLLILNLSRAPVFIQKLFPEGPSTCKTGVQFKCGQCIPKPVPKEALDEAIPSSDWTFKSDRDERNYGLTAEQCDQAFPGLFTEIDESARRREAHAISQDELERTVWPKATIRAMIYDDELYILGYTRPTVRGSRHMATLHSLHRAILTSPTRLPNVEFAITIDDFADNPDNLIWSYTRKADHNNTWLMPDFGFWSWPGSQSAMGGWSQTRRRVQEVEEEYGSLSEKIPKLFWRGNVGVSKRLRKDLLYHTEGKSWADVQSLDWDDVNNLDENLVPVEDHCKYMFIIHTEGNSYSGRLKYIQNCRSLIFAHTLQWIQPFEYLMVSEGPNQNYVSVERDFSDLEEKVQYYLEHPNEAEKIAENSVDTFRNRYLTPAAETCYWRKLINGWSKVSFKPEFYTSDDDGKRRWRGTPFENYALMRRPDFLAGNL